MHNYTTANEYTKATGVVGTVSSENPILTLADPFTRGGPHEVSFYRNPNGRLVLNPWEKGRVVTLTGQDLYALREFLAEFPEESFQRPADPPRWADGDKVIEVRPSNGLNWTWTRTNDGEWRHVKGAWPIGDDEIESHLNASGAGGGDIYIVLRQKSKGIEP